MACKVVGALALCLLMAACGGGGGASDSAGGTPPTPAGPLVPPPGHALGALGVVEDRSAGLVGVDANSNGIRDDVDALIARDYSGTPELSAAARQAALAVQRYMLAQTQQEAVTAAVGIHRAAQCAIGELSGASTAQLRSTMALRLEALTVNTRERLQAYASTARLKAGQTTSIGWGPYCA